MKKNIFDNKGEYIRSEEAELVCGEHFCDICGDCLACYGVDKCINGEEYFSIEHFWVEYEDEA